MLDLFQYEFIRNALATAVLASVACGIIGTYVVVKRVTFISGGIAHASFGGIGLGYLLGVNPLLCLIPFTLVSALGIGFIAKKTRVSEDTAVGIWWAMGMALGVIFIALSPGYAPDLFSYLFGNILTVPHSDLVLMLILDMVIMGVVSVCYKEFLALSFDEEYAKISGVKTMGVYLLLLCLIALTVVMLVRVVGVILVIALLTIPAACARKFSKDLKQMMVFALIFSVVLTVSGLWLSYIFDVPSGATIIVVAGCVFGVVSIIKSRFSFNARS